MDLQVGARGVTVWQVWHLASSILDKLVKRIAFTEAVEAPAGERLGQTNYYVDWSRQDHAVTVTMVGLGARRHVTPDRVAFKLEDIVTDTPLTPFNRLAHEFTP